MSTTVRIVDSTDCVSSSSLARLQAKLSRNLSHAGSTNSISIASATFRYYVQLDTGATLDSRLVWLLSGKPASDDDSSAADSDCVRLEVGPRLSFATSLSTNIVNICKALGLHTVRRVERSTIYSISVGESQNDELVQQILAVIVDPVTESFYASSPTSFELSKGRRPFYEIPLTPDPTSALRKVSEELNLGFDEQDIATYESLFVHKLKRAPTNVELLDLAQSNSEHSRHWFFRARLLIDGVEMPHSLMQLVKSTTDSSNKNNVIKFCDNSSAIRGFSYVNHLVMSEPAVGGANRLARLPCARDIIFTAETHNFPTAVEPFSGATTGTGGRIRDIQACGRGGLPIAATAGYSFGSLNLPDFPMPWEKSNTRYPRNMARPLHIAIDASNGASDYGNKFGEPVLAGFARSFGARLAGERREWIKPIMFSAGIGSVESHDAAKVSARAGQLVVKLGGPVYPIGIGGGAASSVDVQGQRAAAFDQHAVQRGDAEMEQKVQRVLRACVEHGCGIDRKRANLILSIHDQGAGGNANVLKELCAPCGARIEADRFELGDASVSIDELWIAEYQESVAMLIDNSDAGGGGDTALSMEDDGVDGPLALLSAICARERCPMQVVGRVTGSGMIELTDFTNASQVNKTATTGSGLPVEMPLAEVLDGPERKTFKLHRRHRKATGRSTSVRATTYPSTIDEVECSEPDDLTPLNMRFSDADEVDSQSLMEKTARADEGLTATLRSLFETFDDYCFCHDKSVLIALRRVLCLPSVASKRWLTSKVDRSVGGLVAQQQCVGPFDTPLADYALVAMSHYSTVGAATSIGEQPIKITLDPASGARMTVAEALTNLALAPISERRDIKASANWMWPAKLPGEGAALHDAVKGMCELLCAIGVAVDGGKDSLSMVVRCDDGDDAERPSEVVKAPGALVLSMYAPCPDVRLAVTPDFKRCGSKLLYVRGGDDERNGRYRLGGSAFAHVMSDVIGDALDGSARYPLPDIDSPERLAVTFDAIQHCVANGWILAGHDVSDGGLLVCLLEMSFASGMSFDVDIIDMIDGTRNTPLQVLFAEEAGWVLEVDEHRFDDVMHLFNGYSVDGFSLTPINLGKTSLYREDLYASQTPPDTLSSPSISIDGALFFYWNASRGSDHGVRSLRALWEELGFHLDGFEQSTPECAGQERDELFARRRVTALEAYRFAGSARDDDAVRQYLCEFGRPLSVHRVAVVRDEGSNGDRELAAAFDLAGFEVWDVTTSDLLRDGASPNLDMFRGLAFAGGFSYADVCGSARGWAAAFLFNDRLRARLEHFARRRTDTFTLGICNGCQLLCELGLVEAASNRLKSAVTAEASATADERCINNAPSPSHPKCNNGDQVVASASSSNIHLRENLSGRFESRFVSVAVSSNLAESVMLAPLAGSRLGVWVAHREGRFVGLTNEADGKVATVALRYCDDFGQATERYPFNPNGSAGGVAGAMSEDGRHLAIMPHPERGIFLWQWPWLPERFIAPRAGDDRSRTDRRGSDIGDDDGAWTASDTYSPWFLMFRSAKRWCESASANCSD